MYKLMSSCAGVMMKSLEVTPIYKLKPRKVVNVSMEMLTNGNKMQMLTNSENVKRGRKFKRVPLFYFQKLSKDNRKPDDLRVKCLRKTVTAYINNKQDKNCEKENKIESIANTLRDCSSIG